MSGHGEGCNCAATASSAAQSLTEMDWERGVWGAASDGDAQRVARLVEKGSGSGDARDSSGYSALHYAARAGHADVVRVLLESGGADPNALTCGGRATPLQRAAYMGRQECVKMLLGEARIGSSVLIYIRAYFYHADRICQNSSN